MQGRGRNDCGGERFSIEKRSPRTPSRRGAIGKWNSGGRGRFSRTRLSPDPLSRRVAGNRLGFSSRLARPCSLGVFSCFGAMVTAADRAAATCQRWPLYSWRGDRAKVSKGRSQSPLARPQTWPPKSPAAEGAVSRRLTEDAPPSRVRRRVPHAARPRRLCQPPWTYATPSGGAPTLRRNQR